MFLSPSVIDFFQLKFAVSDICISKYYFPLLIFFGLHFVGLSLLGAGGGRNASAPKENGVNNRVERGFNPLPTVPEKTEKNTNSRVTM